LEVTAKPNRPESHSDTEIKHHAALRYPQGTYHLGQHGTARILRQMTLFRQHVICIRIFETTPPQPQCINQRRPVTGGKHSCDSDEPMPLAFEWHGAPRRITS